MQGLKVRIRGYSSSIISFMVFIIWITLLLLPLFLLIIISCSVCVNYGKNISAAEFTELSCYFSNHQMCDSATIDDSHAPAASVAPAVPSVPAERKVIPESPFISIPTTRVSCIFLPPFVSSDRHSCFSPGDKACLISGIQCFFESNRFSCKLAGND